MPYGRWIVSIAGIGVCLLTVITAAAQTPEGYEEAVPSPTDAGASADYFQPSAWIEGGSTEWYPADCSATGCCETGCSYPTEYFSANCCSPGCCEASACGSPPVCDCDDPPQWLRLSAGAMFLHMGGPRNHDLVLDSNTHQTVFNNSNVDLGYQAVPRLEAMANVTEQAAFQFVWFGFNDWNAQRTIYGHNDLSLPGSVGLLNRDFNQVDVIGFNYSTQLQNVEFNFLRQFGESGVYGIVGFRYVSLDEKLRLTGYNHLASLAGSDCDVRTENDLYGGQLGVRYLKQLDWLWLDLSGRAGVYGRSASQHTFIGDFDNTLVLKNTRAYGQDTSFVGDIMLNVLLPVTDHIQLRGGYNFIWISSVARAADQVDQAFHLFRRPALNDHGDAFLHGFNVGVDFVW